MGLLGVVCVTNGVSVGGITEGSVAEVIGRFVVVSGLSVKNPVVLVGSLGLRVLPMSAEGVVVGSVVFDVS